MAIASSSGRTIMNDRPKDSAPRQDRNWKCPTCCGGTGEWVDAGLRAIGLGDVGPALRCAFRSLLALRSIFLLTSLWIFLMAVVALKLSMGLLKNTCSEWRPTGNETSNYEKEFYVNIIRNETTCIFGYPKSFGNVEFKSLGESFFTTFRVATQDNWHYVYIASLVLEVFDWSSVFFGVVIATSYCLLCLFLAVVLGRFSSQKSIRKIIEDLGRALQVSEAAEPVSHPVSRCSSLVIPSSPVGRCLDICCLWECCCRCWYKFAILSSNIVFNPVTEIGICVLLLTHVLFVCSEHHDVDNTLFLPSKEFKVVLVVVFILEALLKLFALSPKRYFQQRWNVFELIVLITSSIELGIEKTSGYSAVLATFKIQRIFRLARYWPSLNFLISSLGKSFSIILQFMFSLGIVTLVVGWIGLKLFGLNYATINQRFPDEEVPRWNFVDLFHSFMIVFRILCGEWSETLHQCLDVKDWTCVPYYLTILVIGKYLLVNVFIAFMLWSFHTSNARATSTDKTIQRLSTAVERIVSGIKHLTGYISKPEVNDPENLRHTCQGREVAIRLKVEDVVAASIAKARREKMLKISGAPSIYIHLDSPPPCCVPNQCYLSNRRSPQWWMRIRSLVLRVTQTIVFDVLVLNAVVLANVLLVTENAPNTWTIHRWFLEIVVPSLYLVEMILRMTSYGWIYFSRSGWWILEFLIVFVIFLNMISFTAVGSSSTIIKSFHAVRLLRILKYGIHFEPSRLVLNTLLGSLPGILNLVLVVAFTWLIYALISVQLLAEKFGHCNDDELVRMSSDPFFDRTTCLQNNYTWTSTQSTFDDIFNSFKSLFHVATFKGWIEIMNTAVDSRGVNEQPIKEANIYMYLHFVIFIIIVAFYSFVALISVILDAFNRYGYAEVKTGPDGYGEAIYRRAVIRISNIVLSAPQRSNGQVRAIFWKLLTNGQFEGIIVACIVTSIITMSCDDLNSSFTLRSNLEFVYVFLVVSLSLELVLRLLATATFLRFFSEIPTVLDLIAFILAIVDVCYLYVVSHYLFPPLILRLARLVEILSRRSCWKHFQGLRRIQLTISASLPHLLCLYLVATCIIIVYSVAGVTVFKSAEFQLVFGDESYSFKTVREASKVMFQLYTSAGWNVVYNILRSCTPGEECVSDNTFGNLYVSIFLISFIFINYVILGTILVVIIQYYQMSCIDIQLGIAPDQYENFYKIWLEYDLVGKGFILYKDLPKFLDTLTGNLRVAKPNSSHIALMDLPIYSGHLVYHKEVLSRLVRTRITNNGYRIDKEDIDESLHAVGCEAVSSSLWRAHEERSADAMRRAWISYRYKTVNLD